MYYCTRIVVLQSRTVTLTVRLPLRVEQKLADYCVKRRVTKSEAVKQALALLLEAPSLAEPELHPFIGVDQGQGADVSGNIKTALRERFRKSRR